MPDSVTVADLAKNVRLSVLQGKSTWTADYDQ